MLHSAWRWQASPEKRLEKRLGDTTRSLPGAGLFVETTLAVKLARRSAHAKKADGFAQQKGRLFSRPFLLASCVAGSIFRYDRGAPVEAVVHTTLDHVGFIRGTDVRN